MMHRLFVSVLFMGLLATAGLAADARPNIVVVLVDDLRWDALGCMGHPYVKTPNIDRLAKEGATFNNCFVTTPLCSPSRASFLTGQFVNRHGIKDNRDNNEASHRLVTFPRHLHDAGYTTAYVGKWHMGNDDMPRPGFDHWCSFKGQGAYKDPVLNVDGKAAKHTGYMTDLLNQAAVDFVKRPATKPFVLFLAHKAVHGPFTPAERHQSLYANAEFKRPESAKDDLSGKPAITANAGKGKAGAKPKPQANPQGPQNLARNQLRCLAAIDEGVGQLLETLAAAQRLDNTMFVFTSDNGYFWGEHGLGDKRWAYEESIRIPMLVRYPPLVQAGRKVAGLTLNIDLAPTLLDLAKVDIPKVMQGRSVLPLLRGETKDWRTSIFAEYYLEPGYERHPTWEAVRTERWKYIHYPANADWDELYDLNSDPVEMKNLVGAPQEKQRVVELQAELKRLRNHRN